MLAINSVNEANLINYCFLAFSGQTAPESCTIQWQIRGKCKRNALECRNSLQVSNPLFKPCSPHLQSVVQQVTLHKSCPFEERSLTHTHAHLHHMTRFQQFTHKHMLFFLHFDTSTQKALKNLLDSLQPSQLNLQLNQTHSRVRGHAL